MKISRESRRDDLHLGIDGRIILKWILDRYEGVGLDAFCTGNERVVGLYERYKAKVHKFFKRL
jgi:hypothetical protein